GIDRGGVEVGGGVLHEPAADVAVAQGAAHDAVLVQNERDPGLVRADAPQRLEHGRRDIDRVGGGGAVQDHEVLHPSRASMLSAAATSVRVSMSTPST